VYNVYITNQFQTTFVTSKEENSQDFCPNYVQEFGLCCGKGTPTKRQVSKRQVSKRPVSKRPVSKLQVYKTSGLENVRFQNVWFQNVQF
jgi:hypothetical protein